MEEERQQTPMSTKLTTMLMFLRDDTSSDISTGSMVKRRTFLNYVIFKRSSLFFLHHYLLFYISEW